MVPLLIPYPWMSSRSAVQSMTHLSECDSMARARDIHGQLHIAHTYSVRLSASGKVTWNIPGWP